MEATKFRDSDTSRLTVVAARFRRPVTIPQTVAAFLAVLTAVRMVLAAQLEPTTVECYYWLFGGHPQWSYFDHPGMIGWTIWLSRTMFGDGFLALRALPILMGSLAVWLTFLTGRRLYGERVGRAAAFWIGLAPLLFVLESKAMPDAPLLMFWAATAWAATRALGGGRPAWWLAAGFFAGLAMESKYYGLFLPLGLLGFLAFSPDHRHWFRRRELWMAAGIALAVNSPTLVWNLAHGWTSLRFQLVDRFQAESTWSWGRLWAFPLSHVLLLTPILAAAAWISGVRTVVRWRTSRWEDRFLASLGVPILAFFLVIAILKPVRDHWAAPAYLTLIVLGCASPPWSSGRWSRWLDGTAAVLAVACLAAPGIVALWPSEYRNSWTHLASDVKRFHPDFALARGYSAASALAYHARPLPACDFTAVGIPQHEFPDWWDPRRFAGGTAVILLERWHQERDVEALKAAFESIEGPFEFTRPDHAGRGGRWLIFVGRGYGSTLKK